MAVRMLFLLFSFVVALNRLKSKESHVLDPHNAPRLAKYISRPVVPVPSDVIYASSMSRSLTATPDPKYIFRVSQQTDAQGNCYPALYIGDPEHRVASPKLPLYAHWNQPLQKTPNNTYITMSCDPSYVLVGNSQVLCRNSNWIGTLGQCVCPAPSSDWCDATAQNVYHFSDCDEDDIPDYICENYDTTNEQVTLTRSIISSHGTTCQSKSSATIKDCPSIFGIFPVALIGQCSGLDYNSASTLNDCSKACAQDQNCIVWQWSNDAKECWLGNPSECYGDDKQWFGGARECFRPQNWCGYPDGGDVYVYKDCDNDGVNDHVCLNGNNGGRIASGSNCEDNWPNAADTDCPTVFGLY